MVRQAVGERLRMRLWKESRSDSPDYLTETTELSDVVFLLAVGVCFHGKEKE